MKLCPACDRHLFGSEPTCPFCGAEQATAAASPAGPAMASVGLTLVLSAAACGPLTSEPIDEGESSSSSTGAVTANASRTGTESGSSTGTTAGSSAEGSTSVGSTGIGSSSSEDDSSDDNACAFYAGCPPDLGGAIECDPFTQNCTDGEKCTPWANGKPVWSAIRCVPVLGGGAPGEPCEVIDDPFSGFDDCAPGVLCFEVDPETNQGTCASLCDVLDPGGCFGDETCSPLFEASAPPGFETLGTCTSPK